MQACGSDSCRPAGGKWILRSTTSKGWTPRTPRTGTSAEHPGTAVLWEDAYFEVVSAEAAREGAIVYVLAPWRDELTMRQFDRYDEESEAGRAADAAHAAKQRRHSALGRIAGVVLGNLPEPVQEHLGNELGVSPARMTQLSAIPPFALLVWCTWSFAGAMLEQRPAGIPVWLAALVLLLISDAAIRFFVAFTQGRGVGSLPGTLIYTVVWAFAPGKSGLVSPFGGRGWGVRTSPPPPDIAIRDSVAMREPLLTLLAPADQLRLAKTCGFDYRRLAVRVSWVILMSSASGVAGLARRVWSGEGVGVFVSFALALVLATDQLRRLVVLRRGPAGSVLSPFLRPFMRDLLERN